MDERLIALFHRHVAAAYDRQMRLADLIERDAPGAAWNYNVPTAELTFGTELKFEAQLLGTHAENGSWMWAWSNPGANLPAENQKLADAVRGLAATTGVPMFATNEMSACEPLLGPDVAFAAAHVFGIVVGGELGYNAYYTMPYASGRAICLIRDERLRCDESHPLVRVASIFPRAICDYPILDHRAALLGYLDSYGFAPAVEGTAVRLVENGEEVLRAEFDELNRLTNLTGHLKGQQ